MTDRESDKKPEGTINEIRGLLSFLYRFINPGHFSSRATWDLA